MADEPLDPVAGFLKTLNTSDRARAAAFDAVYNVHDDAQAEQVMRALPFSDEVRSQLWEARQGTMPKAAPQATPQPFAGVGIQTVPDLQWAQMSPQEKMNGMLTAAGHAIGFGTKPFVDAVDNPKTTLATAAVSAAAPAIVDRIPRFTRAGANFQDVMGAAKDVPVETQPYGDELLRVKQLAERGGTLPKPVNDLLKRATDPNKPDITYDEMRDFYSNMSRLSADEMNRLTPVMKSAVGNLRAAMNSALTNAASSVGKGSQYTSAMREYANAARFREGADAVKSVILRKVLPAAAAGMSGAYGAKKMYDAMRTPSE